MEGNFSLKSYDPRLNDAWETASDIHFNRGNILDILEVSSADEVFNNFSISEVLHKIRLFEAKKIIENSKTKDGQS